MRLADEFGQVPVMILVCATSKGSGAAGSVIPAVQNLLLAARALGVGGTITTLHSLVEERVHKLFGIPPTARWSTASPWGTREDGSVPTSVNPSPRCVPTIIGVRHPPGANSSCTTWTTHGRIQSGDRGNPEESAEEVGRLGYAVAPRVTGAVEWY